MKVTYAKMAYQLPYGTWIDVRGQMDTDMWVFVPTGWYWDKHKNLHRKGYKEPLLWFRTMHPLYEYGGDFVRSAFGITR